MANVVTPEADLPDVLKKSILTPKDVRSFLADSTGNNHLLDDVEFDDPRIWLAMRMAISEYNELPPVSRVTAEIFPGLSTLMYGTCYHLFAGQTALAARNQMSYSDGGLNVPVEERYGLYQQLSQYYNSLWTQSAKLTKAARNMESAYEFVYSDYSGFPNW